MRIILLLLASLTLCHAQTQGQVSTIYCNPYWNYLSYWGGTQPFMQFSISKGNTGYLSPGGGKALLPGQCTGATAGLGPNDGGYARYFLNPSDIVVVQGVGYMDTFNGQTRPSSIPYTTQFIVDPTDAKSKIMYTMGGLGPVIAFTVTFQYDSMGSWYIITDIQNAPPGGTSAPTSPVVKQPPDCTPVNGRCIPRSADPSINIDAPVIAAPAAGTSSSSNLTATSPIFVAWFAGGFLAGIMCLLLTQFIMIKHQQRKSTPVENTTVQQDTITTAA